MLVVGSRVGAAVRELRSHGYDCAALKDTHALPSAAEQLRPEAVVLGLSGNHASRMLAAIRGCATLQDVPVLADASGVDAHRMGSLGVDDWIPSRALLISKVEAVLQARRLVERDLRRTRRMESLLEITQAATSSLDLTEILRIAVEKISRVIRTDRCSVVLIEGNSPRVASVVASVENPRMAPLQLDLAKYPELRRSLETRRPIYIEDASRDPLLDEVRPQIESLGGMSIFVLPLICQDDLLGALFLRLSREEGAFETEDQEFAQAVSGALANSVRNARLHAALKRKREDLESAYVDRYRELNEANRRLKEVNRLKDELIAVCSHDLRAPLQVLLGHARLLQESKLAPSQLDSAEVVARQAKKILGLVESLLDRGKGDQVRVALDARLLDLGNLCREVAAEFKILAAQKDVTLTVLGTEQLPAIVDEVKIREVLQNLLTNAIRHARHGGEVTLQFSKLLRPDMDLGHVVVRDDGEGMTEEQRHLVFDRYRHGPGGIGLGLAICREFVDLHGGEIWAESPEGAGAAFVFTLPLARPTATSSGPVTPAAEQSRVLLVEDEAAVAALMEEILRTRYRVEVARDGAEGLAKAKALHPDLVVMDVFLPRMDGLDAAVALKASSDTHDIPVILVSAHRGVADKVKALNLGAVDYLSKPFQAIELLNRTERALNLARTERDFARSLSLLKQTGRDLHTGLYDRLGLINRLNQESSRSRRYGRPLSIARLEVGPLAVNLLRNLGTTLQQRLRAADIVAHLGEGIFVVMFPESTAAIAQAALERLLPGLEGVAGVQPKIHLLDVPEKEIPEAILDRLLTL